MSPRSSMYEVDDHELGEGEESGSNSEATEASDKSDPRSVKGLLERSVAIDKSETYTFSPVLDLDSAVEVGLHAFREKTTTQICHAQICHAQICHTQL